ncbi:MAG: DUF2090 domain-containing protein [Candidatus Levybacteria bacterium]|nr:DUF2090 domain-containing protein [Candidatus Levybacteria bacterium]
MQDLGYDKPLYILPFDHRSAFAPLFNVTSASDLDSLQRHAIKELKMLIYKGFKKALDMGIPAEFGAILCDEEFGQEVLIDAKHNGFITILTTEKSGESEFKFQYPDSFEDHILSMRPTFAKALVRYNPKDPQNIKDSQKKNLKLLSDFSHQENFKFLLEVLIVPNTKQLSEFADREEFDRNLRPNLAVEVIDELQSFGVEPDVWKLEGFEEIKDYKLVLEEIKKDNRERVGLVILGRGAAEEKVEEWLKIGSGIKGVIGFAVGRTVFWQAIEKFHKGEVGKAEVIDTVSSNFYKFYKIFTGK